MFVDCLGVLIDGCAYIVNGLNAFCRLGALGTFYFNDRTVFFPLSYDTVLVYHSHPYRILCPFISPITVKNKTRQRKISKQPVSRARRPFTDRQTDRQTDKQREEKERGERERERERDERGAGVWLLEPSPPRAGRNKEQ